MSQERTCHKIWHVCPCSLNVRVRSRFEFQVWQEPCETLKLPFFLCSLVFSTNFDRIGHRVYFWWTILLYRALHAFWFLEKKPKAKFAYCISANSFCPWIVSAGQIQKRIASRETIHGNTVCSSDSTNAKKNPLMHTCTHKKGIE